MFMMMKTIFKKTALKTLNVTRIETITRNPYSPLSRNMQTKPKGISTGLEFILKTGQMKRALKCPYYLLYYF